MTKKLFLTYKITISITIAPAPMLIRPCILVSGGLARILCVSANDVVAANFVSFCEVLEFLCLSRRAPRMSSPEVKMFYATLFVCPSSVFTIIRLVNPDVRIGELFIN